MFIHTHKILPNTYTDIHHLPLPCVRSVTHTVQRCPLLTLFITFLSCLSTHHPSLSLSLIVPPSRMCRTAVRGKRKERRKLLQFSPALALPLDTLTTTRVHALESQRGKTLQVNACDLTEQNLCTLPTTLKDAHTHTHKHTPSRSLGPCGLVLERASFLRLRQRKLGTDRGPGTSASKPQEALVLSLPVEGVGAWGASCLCFHSQGRTGMSVCVYVSQTG